MKSIMEELRREEEDMQDLLAEEAEHFASYDFEEDDDSPFYPQKGEIWSSRPIVSYFDEGRMLLERIENPPMVCITQTGKKMPWGDVLCRGYILTPDANQHLLDDERCLLVNKQEFVAHVWAEFPFSWSQLCEKIGVTDLEFEKPTVNLTAEQGKLREKFLEEVSIITATADARRQKWEWQNS